MSGKPAWANWNGVEMPLDDVKVSVLDRSFLFGDAVYEVVRIYGGLPFLLGEHLRRMAGCLKELRIEFSVDALESRCMALLQHSAVSEGTLYLHVSRGAAPRTHHFPEQPTTPNALVYAKELSDESYARQRSTGARTILVPDLRWKRCDIKSVNLLANCLAAQAAREAGCAEAILVEADGSLVEGSHSSIFGVRDGALLTYPLGANILPGITRKLVVHIAHKVGLPVREAALRQEDLSTLQEMFLTGTTSEVMPIIQVDEVTIGSGRPGPVVARLQEQYRELAQQALWEVPA